MTAFDQNDMTTRRLPEGFIPSATLDPSTSIPLRRQIYDWLRGAIAEARMRPGQRVPSTRRLARELNVSRITVLWAYEQLIAEGYLQSSRGSGTVIATSIPEPVGSGNVRTAGVRWRPGRKVCLSRAAAKLLRLPEEHSLPVAGTFRNTPALEHFPHRAWSRLISRHARRTPAQDLGYADPMGDPVLRAAIAEYLGTVRGARCEMTQIMITAGSQQALHFTLRALLDPGDRVWVEEPGYPGAHRALLMSGCKPVAVPVDGEGLIVERGVHRCVSARAAYVTPSHHFPLGMTLSAGRRLQLLNWAQRADAWIIEDDYDSEYRFGGQPLSSLQGLDGDARVIYVGTFSKVCYPALRIGYLILPPCLVPAFRAVRDAIDIFPPVLQQRALADFMREGQFARHIRRMRALYAERRERLILALKSQFGDAIEVISAMAGIHLVLRMPAGVDDQSVAARARAAGIGCTALSTCYLGRAQWRGLILGYGGVASGQIDEAVRRLATIAAPGCKNGC